VVDRIVGQLAFQRDPAEMQPMCALLNERLRELRDSGSDPDWGRGFGLIEIRVGECEVVSGAEDGAYGVKNGRFRAVAGANETRKRGIEAPIESLDASEVLDYESAESHRV